MKHITVLIPTRNRVAKLKRTLATIPQAEWISVWVVCDGCIDSLQAVEAMGRTDVTPYYFANHRGSVACRNAVAPMVPDGLLYATDDIGFWEGSLQTALDVFNAKFPDDDGVVGFMQTTSHHETGVALIGSKFLARYPDRRPFCPDYWHFAAQEVKWLADHVGRFHYERAAVLEHYSRPGDADQTHYDARVRKAQDIALRNERRKRGLIWGLA